MYIDKLIFFSLIQRRSISLNMEINLEEFRFNAGNVTSDLMHSIANQVTTRSDAFVEAQLQNAVAAVEAIIVNFINAVTI